MVVGSQEPCGGGSVGPFLVPDFAFWSALPGTCASFQVNGSRMKLSLPANKNRS